jgi:hypothetical protein
MAFGGEDMIDVIPILLFVLTGLTWLMWSITAHKLLRLFVAKYPDVARERIPYAFDSFRHPEKGFFFLRKQSDPILQQDPVIWRLTCIVRKLMLLSIVVPVGGFSILALVAYVLSR